MMYAKYVQKGDSIDYRPNEAVAAGDVIVLADLVGIARLDIEAGTLGSLAVVGVFDVVKAAGAIPSGSTLYWDAGAKQATLFSASNHYLGKAIADVEAGDESVRVLLNAPIASGGSSSTPAVGMIPNIVDNSGSSAFQHHSGIDRFGHARCRCVTQQ
ncbi:DUF2190 family protein [Victivallis sp. Marseille-Q1083]|uniref:DUF2190 family protein n=1 Tax=Victivallis sp. Marseille-Q1083 TaxID=2717288 RepID=UPI00158DDC30|nr:DUF2190 family protein [Victivallis sp. Marseille-Q1083]